VKKMMNERPIDVLNKAKNKKVWIKLKNNEEVTGVLLSLDLHLNMSLKNVEIVNEKKKKVENLLIRGDAVVYVSPE